MSIRFSYPPGSGGGGGSGNPAGSGSEVQYRIDGTTFGALTSSSVSGSALTLGGAFTVAGGVITLQNGSTTGLSFGADVNAFTRTASTRKLAAFSSPDFANTRTVEWFTFDADSSGSNNAVSFGGRVGATTFASTTLDFCTAPTVSTTGGTLRIRINNDGQVGVANTLRIGGTTAPTNTTAGDTTTIRLNIGTQASLTTANAQSLIIPTVSTVMGQVIRGAASQSGDLLEFQDSASAVLSYIDSVGRFYAPNTASTTVPSISFNGDTDTGFAVNGAGTLEFISAGSERARMTGSNFATTGAFRVGSTTAPTNNTAGDITGTRLIIGTNNSITANGVDSFLLSSSSTVTSGLTTIQGNYHSLDPASASSSSARSTTFSLRIATSNVQNFTGQLSSVWAENRFFGGNDITTSISVQANNIIWAPSAPTAFGTITDAIGLNASGINFNPSTVAAGTNTVTRSIGVRATQANLNGNSLTLTGQAGVVIAAHTVATNNSHLVIGNTAIPTGNWAIYSYLNSASFFDGFIGLSTTTPAAQLHFGGNVSAAAWTTSGIRLRVDSGTVTDTSSSGTVSNMGVSAIAGSAVAASSATTYTNAATLFIGGAPTAGANVTITNALALQVQGGTSWFRGNVLLGAASTGAAQAQLHLQSNQTATAWGVSGAGIRVQSATYTDTSSSGTVAATAVHGFGTPTLAASSATTYTDAATLRLNAVPVAGSNVTITNAYSLIAAGNSRFDGNISIGTAAPTARLHLAAGTATASNAPLKFTSGTNLTSPEAGAFEFNGTSLFFTPSATRRTVVLDAETQTLTNKRITQRTGTAASSATPTINTDNVDFYSLTALAVNVTSFTTNLSGTPTENQSLNIAITGTAARTLAFGASFEAGAVPLPTTTVSTTRLDVAFRWNSVTSRWRCMASG